MKNLLAVTALLETGTGLLLVALPSQLAALLLGARLDAPAAVTVARVGGIALLAIGVTCWSSRLEGPSRAARGLVSALLLYNTGVALVLVHGALVMGLAGMGLWPVVLVHGAMAGWCLKGSPR